MSEARDHHYVPQFYLRNFAVDIEKLKLTTVAKHGDRAVWARRSIKSLGFERDLYVSIEGGVPISAEALINKRVETPISESDTWAKIASNKTELLDETDKPIIYALIQHFHVRTPHYVAMLKELSNLSGQSENLQRFSEGERLVYAGIRNKPDFLQKLFVTSSTSLVWTEEAYRMACIAIYRSPIPVRTLSVPVLPIKVQYDPALHLPLPGLTPFQLALALNPTTIATLVLANFEDRFVNVEISRDAAAGFNRHFVAQFSYYAGIRHIVTGREDLCADMAWASYSVSEERPDRIVFRRRAA